MQPISNTFRMRETDSWFDMNSYIDDDQLLGPKIPYFNQLKEMAETQAKEQLEDLFILCRLKTGEKEIYYNRILYFAFNIIKKSDLTLTESRSIIGKLIYLVNKDIDNVNFILKNKSSDTQIKEIYNAFDQELQAINNNLLQFKEEHAQGMLQDPEKALSVKIPIELAKALISDSGFVNIGIIEPLMQYFLSNRKMPFEKNIAFALNSLKRSLFLRQKVHLIPCPYSQTMPINDIIRITLGLSKTTTTAIDAKKAALVAMISHLRQSPASSCFASFVAIEILSKQLECCLDDFRDLIQQSHLLRSVDGQLKEFSFLMRMGDESVSKIVVLDNKGQIYLNGLSCFLWEVPGIKAACKTLSIKSKKNFLANISLEILGKNQKTAEFSISKILKAIANKAAGDTNYNYYCAKLSFESQLHNPLLRIWENAIANMAEASEHGKLTESLISSLVKPLSKLIEAIPIREEFKRNFHKHILESAHYAYDSDIKAKEVSSDGRSDRGAFVLYNKSGTTSRKEWKLIKDDQDFRQFVVEVANKSLFNKKKETALKIKEFIQSDKFMIDCLHFYNIQNEGITENDLKNIKNVAHTPWKDQTGNNSNTVLKIYSKEMLFVTPLALIPKNALKLLRNLIEIGRKLSDKTKNNLKENNGYLSPAIIKGMHAFSIMFGHESFKGAFYSDKPVFDWINEHLILPGKKISEMKITKEMQKEVCFFIANKVIGKEKAVLEQFHAKSQALAPNLTLNAFRNSIIEIMKQIQNENSLPIKQITTGIDYCIFKKTLSKEIQNELTKSSIHFADTNWCNVLHDVHFCIIFNPASAQLEIWEVYEDGTGLYPLCQDDWLSKTWEIYSP